MAGNYNIGPRIGIEGEAEFRKQISRINQEYKAMASYTGAVSKSMEQQGKSQEALAAKQNGLRQQIALQQKAYKEYEGVLAKVKALEGDHADEILRYEGALLHTKTTIAGLEAELSDTEREMQDLADGIEDVGEEAQETDRELGSFGDILKANLAAGVIQDGIREVGEFLVDLGKEAISAASDVRAANAQFSQTFGDLEDTAERALQNISDETGIAATRIQGAYTSLYAFTKSVGGDSATALSIAQRAMNAAADSAAYYDKSVEDATETLQSFLKGNYENDAALGIAATETTRNAKANEMYAKSFQDLNEVQKVDVLLAMVEAGNQASGALGQAAREADAWANVTGEAAEATRMLMAALGDPILSAVTPLIQGYTKALQALTQESSFDRLRTEVEGFREGMEAAEAALSDSASSIAATAGLAQQYVERLKALERQGLDTADAQREYAQTVELLNTLMPELGLSINDYTGLLDQNTGAIEENIEALEAQARQQAAQAYYKSIVDEYTKAYEAQYAAERRLLELQAQQTVLLQQGADASRVYATSTQMIAGEMVTLTGTYSENDAALASNLTEQKLLQEQLETLNADLAAHERQLTEATEATEDLSAEQKTLVKAVDPVVGTMENLYQTYYSVKESALESINSQIGLFQDLGEKSEWTAKKIIENWESQQRAFANYSANLKKAMDMGLDEALIAQLSDGSVQSMQILDAMVNDAEISVAEINAAFRKTEEAKDALTDTYAEMRTVTSREFAVMVKYAEAAGVDIVDGAIAGIDGNIDRYVQALKRMALRGQRGYNEQWTINSPSKWMRQASDYIVDGGVLQVQDRIQDMERAMEDLARSGQRAYQREQLAWADDYPGMVAGAPGYATTTTTNNRHVAYGGISININTQAGQDPQTIADAVISELTARLGREEAAFG